MDDMTTARIREATFKLLFALLMVGFLIFVLSFGGKGDVEKEKAIEYKDNACFKSCRRVKFDKHIYIRFEDVDGTFLCHDPDCPCKKARTE